MKTVRAPQSTISGKTEMVAGVVSNCRAPWLETITPEAPCLKASRVFLTKTAKSQFVSKPGSGSV